MKLLDATRHKISLNDIEDVAFASFENKEIAIAVGAIYTGKTGYKSWPPKEGNWFYSFDSGEWEEEK